MSQILRPPWTQQPTQAVPVDWGNGLTRKLISAVYGERPADAVRGNYARLQPRKYGRFGCAAENNASFCPITWTQAPLNIPSGSDFTLVFVVQQAVLSGNNPGLMRSGSFTDASGVAGTGSTFTIVKGAGAYRPWIRLNGSDILNPSSGAQLDVGGSYVIIYRVASASAYAVFWDGIKQYSGAHAVATPSFDIYGVGAQSGPSESVGPLAGFMAFARALSDAECVALCQNPWQIFQPAPRRLWVVPGAAGGITGTLSATLDDVTVSASGVVDHSGTLAATLADVSVSASGVVGHSGDLAVTLDDVSVAITGTVAAAGTGTISITLDDVTTAITGVVGHPGTLAANLDDVSVSISGTVTPTAKAITGDLAITLDDVVVAMESPSGKVGGDDVPLTKAQAKALLRKQRKAEEARRQRWAQDKHDDAALSEEIGSLYRRLRGEEQPPAVEEIAIPEAVEAPRAAILGAVQALPVPDEDYSQVAAAIMQMVERVREHQEHQQRLMEEDELILLMVA